MATVEHRQPSHEERDEPHHDEKELHEEPEQYVSKAKESVLTDDEDAMDHHESQKQAMPQRTEEMLAMELASGKVSKNAFFEKFTQLWARRRMVDKFKASLHVKYATEIVGTSTTKLRERLTKIDQKKKELQEKMNMPPFVRTIDKLGFVIGILLMLATEALIDKPDYMYKFYTGLMFPLMIHRFASYHRLKWHYFMLDFCYYCQVLLLFYVYWHYRNPVFFQFVFCLSNGPLAGAIVMWKNSLVFHDIDKMISLFIHIYPPIVTYTLRWWHTDTFVVCQDQDCSISWTASFWMPLILYSFWQALYIVKTELVDRKKLQSDSSIMTSLRWFVREDKPHPIYKALLKKGIRIKPLFLLVAIQFTYTMLTLAPMYWAYQNFYVHTACLIFVFCACAWYGATFYFEVFSESYTKRLSVRMKKDKEKEEKKKGLPTKNSFFSFLLFAIPTLTSLYSLIEWALARTV